MKCIPVQTRLLVPPRDDLFSALDESLPDLAEGDMLAVTSKVISIHQGRCIRVEPGVLKDDIIRSEAERFIPREEVPDERVILTIKSHTIIPSAGIDESNGNGHYVLWPERIQESARNIWKHVRSARRISNLGVVITDSHSVPLRSGVVGISIGFFGFHPVIRKAGVQDLFGRTTRYGRIDVPDAVAASAVFVMGEVDERQPLAIVRGVEGVTFTDEDTYREWVIHPDEDIFKPLTDRFSKQGGSASDHQP